MNKDDGAAGSSPRRRGQWSSDDAARLNKELNRAARRLLIGRLLAVLALLIAGQHVLAHAGWQPLPIGMGWQDLLVGYPMAAVLGVVAAIVWGNTPGRA